MENAPFVGGLLLSLDTTFSTVGSPGQDKALKKKSQRNLSTQNITLESIALTPQLVETD